MRVNHLLGMLVALVGCYGTIDGSGGSTGGPGGGGGGGGGAEGPDAGASAGGVDAASPTPDGPAAVQCKDKVTSGIGSGQHNAGQDCNQGCHNHGFTLAGTLYAGLNSNTPVVGATITVTDANGKTFDIISQQNGNFYTKTAVTFPVKVVASSCPDTQPMIGTIAAGNGGCLKSGCHQAGGAGKIHLP